ncbi:response regulator [Eleftheria terrae]|uniref:response regulator n=1 Tax=Eleftheria terrae TaxID=1597781 RepID=UPI00263BD6DD|nr:response regulator [Eleftheria terrae]WKB51390.1 response regulator [Eleftheria terrae]
MSVPYRVAVQGFNQVERATLDAFFRLAARRSPAYRQVSELHACDYVIADADAQPELVHDVLRSAGRWDVTLFVGAGEARGALARLPRPLNPAHVLRVLDEAVRQGGERAPPQEPTPSPHRLPPPALPPLSAHPLRRSPADARLRDFQHSSTFSNSVLIEGDDKYEHILVVDDSELSLRFMQSRLKRFGFKVHLAHGGEEALALLEQRQFDFVFLDVMMPGMDGYQTCRSIKRRALPPGQQMPVVVLLSSRAGAIDKIRGTLAGCDAYLTKPLDEQELVRVIGSHHEVFQRAFDSTQGISTTRPAAP